MISRRRFLQATAATIATSSGFGYMHYCEPGWFELIRHRLAGNDSNLLIVFYVQIMPDD
ncbi:twin-arginine translocation signal domain-containing protein, partial [Escherichia coli]|nr:twin-arginine translocation signal domain-containing protein [Escherichia coli]